MTKAQENAARKALQKELDKHYTEAEQYNLAFYGDVHEGSIYKWIFDNLEGKKVTYIYNLAFKTITIRS